MHQLLICTNQGIQIQTFAEDSDGQPRNQNVVESRFEAASKDRNNIAVFWYHNGSTKKFAFLVA